MSLLSDMLDRARKVKADLDAEREKEKRDKLAKELERVIELAPSYTSQNAFCGVCERDCRVMLRKHGNERLAYYKGFCPLGHEVRREIVLYDRYYDVSKLVREERDKHSDDMLTPNDARFRTVYPKEWAELERQREERERVEKDRGVGVNV